MIVVAGVGPGNPKLLTVQVKEAIESFDHVIAFGRVSQSLVSIRPDITEVTRVSDLEDKIKGKDQVLVLASGDPLFYGVTKYLMSLGIQVEEVYPGISSLQYFASRLKKPWNDYRLISLHGRDFNFKEFEKNPLAISLLDKDHSPSWLSNELKIHGFSGKLIVGYRLSYDDELIEEIEIGQEASDIDALAVAVIEIEMAK
ncbi:precorrin-6y C5,15-methyltransferase (decarboxylating) subunit CbiE [Urinicoccus timonensis]|uniref:precorrin-6y C5,15-methyltransferase (decarboxylating) subunit CbiE n=1 Tax=Urinicoccus timonensis TaxID=2024205 RepID=UPI000C07BE0E|nr:precorrin-6y C5,15-methyltransferase (decarboxylating) subunit CbiE [Urinicoccus timonensis]